MARPLKSTPILDLNLDQDIFSKDGSALFEILNDINAINVARNVARPLKFPAIMDLNMC